MTHGELYYHRRANLDFTHDIDKILRSIDRLPARMPRIQALNYYGDKISKFFGTEEVTMRDFRKVDEYYDYFEAKRLLSKERVIK